MYLSRIELDMNKRATMIALSTPSMFHGAIESSFSGERPHCLWRIDSIGGRRYLLILSENSPCLDSICEEYGEVGSGESLQYEKLLNQLVEGSTWQFRLCANPTYSVANNEKRGRVCAHTTIENQRGWLIRQSEQHGFSLTADSFDIKEKRWYSFGKSKHKVTLLSVTYEGILSVTDARKFSEAMVNGIGRGKAYGMGLITLMRPSNV